MSNTIAFIPARCGSQSIKLKNIKSFCGKPLIYWNCKSLQECNKIDKIIVATDCDEIKNVVEEFNFSKIDIYKRLSKNASNSASTESVMLEFIEKNKINDETTFILTQATSPFTKSEDFCAALDLFNLKKYKSILSCSKIKRFFWKKNGTPINYDYTKRPRRQDFEGELVENGAFYINSVSNIKKYKNRLSGKIGIYEMPEYTFTELDEDYDWIIAETLMKEFVLKKQSENKKIKLFLADVDGTLTDSGMYYSENGDEMKRFSTYDGKAFELLRAKNIFTGIITSENMQLNKKRAKKLKLDFSFHGNHNKLKTITELCNKLNISLSEVAFIGDDINDFDLLSNVGISACPTNAIDRIKDIPGIIKLKKQGGFGAVREFVELLI